MSDDQRKRAEAHARQAAQPGATHVQGEPSAVGLPVETTGPQAGEVTLQHVSPDLGGIIDVLLDTLVKKVLIPEIHKHFGGTVPRVVLDAATDRLLQGIRRGEAGNTFQTGKQLTLFALNEALRTVDEARQ